MSIITIIMMTSVAAAMTMITRSMSITMTTTMMRSAAVAMTMITKSMSTIITMTRSAAAAMTTTMTSTSIIITTMTASVAAAMIMTMSTIITTTVSAAVDMTIITIMQMRSSQAGAVRQLKNSHVRDLRRSLRHFPSLTNMVSSSVQKECFRQRTEHGSILIWFRKKPRSVRAHRNIQAVCA